MILPQMPSSTPICSTAKVYSYSEFCSRQALAAEICACKQIHGLDLTLVLNVSLQRDRALELAAQLKAENEGLRREVAEVNYFMPCVVCRHAQL